ncbi:MAG TPA: ABC transporter substrate-binding protein [Thermoplasmata archaeon]|nr:ABC transporter substrate-binding protein [Thermoplasmata archaeon]
MHLPGASAAPRASRLRGSVVWLAVILIVGAGATAVAAAAYYESRSNCAAGTIKVTDDLGRQDCIPANPQRVVVLGPSIMDSMYRLGLRNLVVGVDCYAPDLGGLSDDYSADQIALWNLSSSMCVQTGPTFDVETLIALDPQVVLAATIVSVADVEQISQTYHIPVVMIQPSTLEGVVADEELLGEVFNVPSAAGTLITTLEATLTEAQDLQSRLAANETAFPSVIVTYSTDSDGYWTFGPGTFGDSLIRLASGTSISSNASLPYPELSGEQVLASNPAYLVYGTGFGLNESSFTSAPFWSQLSATQDGNAVGMDSNYFTEPDPTMVLIGLPQLIGILHPGASL